MEGVVKKKFPNTMKLSHLRVCGEFWNLRGQHNREENTHTPTPTHTPTHTHTHTEYTPHCNSQWRISPDTCVCYQGAGVEQGGTGCMLRVRTRPECPEDNLRELM